MAKIQKLKRFTLKTFMFWSSVCIFQRNSMHNFSSASTVGKESDIKPEPNMLNLFNNEAQAVRLNVHRTGIGCVEHAFSRSGESLPEGLYILK